MRNKSDIPLENEQNITDTSNSKQGKSKGRFCGLCRGGDKREQRVEGKSKSQEEEATSNKEKPPTDNKERSEINPSSSKHKLEEYAASAAQVYINIYIYIYIANEQYSRLQCNREHYITPTREIIILRDNEPKNWKGELKPS